jgi:hypothetical protein
MDIVTTKEIYTTLRAMLGNSITSLVKAKMPRTCGMKIAADSQDTIAVRDTPSGKLLVRETDIITVRDTDATEIIRIDPTGRIFWKQREVETDDDFRKAMLDLADALKGRSK